MISFLLKILAIIALLGAIISGLIDAANSIASSKVIMSSLQSFWQSLSSQSYTSFQNWSQNTLGENVWNEWISPIIHSPAWLVLLIISIILFLLAPRR
ncbi:hypothetical protein [Bartonella sp. DGB1]|uniref:hypothetical protein n=1 Tax=Bartonella sp. DGB1 TaxID=3239807 RepID=UPI003525387F